MAEEEIRVLACIPTLIKPLPVDLLCSAAEESGRVVVAEEGCVQWGWGAEIAARIHECLFGRLRAAVRRVGAVNIAIPAARTLERVVLPTETTSECNIRGLAVTRFIRTPLVNANDDAVLLSAWTKPTSHW